MVERQVGEHLAVETDALLAEGVDKAAVVHSLRTRGGVDTGDPQTAEAAFFEFPVAESVLPAFFKGVFCDGVDFRAGAEVAAGG